MDLTRLNVVKVKAAAAALQGQLRSLKLGVEEAGLLGSWTIHQMDADAGLQIIAEAADANADHAMLERLLSAITFPERYAIIFNRVTPEGRGRVAAAQLYRVLQGDRAYPALKGRIDLLEILEAPLRTMARDPQIFAGLDDPKSYLGKSRLVQTQSGAAATIAAHHEQWYLNQALLLQALEANPNAEVKSRLAVIMLQAFNKAAKVNEAELLGYVSTPFGDAVGQQARPTAPLYHRSEVTNQLLVKCAEAITAKMALDGAVWFTARPVHNQTFRHVVKRAFCFRDTPAKVDDEQGFKDAVDRLFAHLEAGGIPGNPVAIEVTALHALRGDAVGADLERLFGERKDVFVGQQRIAKGGAFDEPALLVEIKKLRAMLFAVVFKRYVIPGGPGVPPPLGPALAHAADAPPPDRILACGLTVTPVGVTPRLTVTGLVDPGTESWVRPPVDVLLLPKAFLGEAESVGTILEGLNLAMIHTGYRMDPLQTKKIWAAMKSYPDILRECHIEMTRLATSGRAIPLVFAGFGLFLRHPVFARFEGLAANPLPYVKVLSKATADLLRGLLELKMTEVAGLQAYLTKSGPDPVYAGAGTVAIAPVAPGRDVYTDAACTVAVGPLPADRLEATVPLYVRGEAVDDVTVTLTLAASGNERIVVGDAATCRPFGLMPAPESRAGIDKSYAKMGLTDLLQTSYFRMLTALTNAADLHADPIRFLNEVEVIHQEIAAILTLVEPHGRGAFQDAFNAAVTAGNLIPAAMRPARVHLKPSAMHCLASAVAGVEAMAGTNLLKVVLLRDCYYESEFALGEWRSFKRFTLVGDDCSILDGDVPLLLKDGLPDSVPRGDARWTPFKPLHLFIADFHHNISIERNDYKVENLIEQVGRLYAKELVAPRFTVAIDCTIDLIRSTDVQAFLEAFAGKIADGTLNVVLFRSAQKFDMLGMDNFYGGYTVSLNDGVNWAAFNTAMNDPDDQLEGANRQGLTHLMKYAAASLDAYRLAAMANTKALYDALPASARHGGPDPMGHMVFSRIEDPRCAFLDIKFPGAGDNEAELKAVAAKIQEKIVKFADAKKLPLTSRASFGFPTTNLTLISGSKVRLNPGLDAPEAMTAYAAFFKKIHEQLLAKPLDRASPDYPKDLIAALSAVPVE